MKEQNKIIEKFEISDYKSLSCYKNFSFFHTPYWLEVLKETYGFKYKFLEQNFNNSNIFLPVCLINQPFRKKKIISLPFSDHCSPLYNNADDFKLFFKQFIAYSLSIGFQEIEIRSFNNDLNLEEKFLKQDYCHILKLDKDISDLFKSLSNNHQRNIKKAEKQNIKVLVMNSLEGMSVFYNMACFTRKRQGLPPQPFSFYKNILKFIIEPGFGNIFLTSSENRYLSGAIYLHFQDKVIYKFGASFENHKDLKPNHLLMWKAISQYKNWGYNTFDFGRTELQHQTLRQYKLGWGTDEKFIYTYLYNVRINNFTKPVSETTGFHNHLFQILPVFILKSIGNLFYKYAA